MGLYDREYARDEQPGIWVGKDWSLVTWVIVINLAIYVIQILSRDPLGGDGTFTEFLSLRVNLFNRELLTHPWWLVELVTYGFAHDPQNIFHIAFNLYFFWLFGRELEARYGSRVFGWMYVTSIIAAGLGWMLLMNMTYPGEKATMIGASGGVSAVIALFVLLFSKQNINVWGVLTMPIWVFGILWFFGDIRGALERSGEVAYTAHIAGALYGLLFYRTGWSLLSILPANMTWKRLTGPKLRVHNPEESEESMAAQMDEILAKIHEHGQDSLTARERKFMETAARKYQQKHR